MRICRFCLIPDIRKQFVSCFDNGGAIIAKVYDLFKVVVVETVADSPALLCRKCEKHICQAAELKKVIQNSEEHFRSTLKNDQMFHENLKELRLVAPCDNTGWKSLSTNSEFSSSLRPQALQSPAFDIIKGLPDISLKYLDPVPSTSHKNSERTDLVEKITKTAFDKPLSIPKLNSQVKTYERRLKKESKPLNKAENVKNPIVKTLESVKLQEHVSTILEPLVKSPEQSARKEETLESAASKTEILVKNTVKLDKNKSQLKTYVNKSKQLIRTEKQASKSPENNFLNNQTSSDLQPTQNVAKNPETISENVAKSAQQPSIEESMKILNQYELEDFWKDADDMLNMLDLESFESFSEENDKNTLVSLKKPRKVKKKRRSGNKWSHVKKLQREKMLSCKKSVMTAKSTQASETIPIHPEPKQVAAPPVIVKLSETANTAKSTPSFALMPIPPQPKQIAVSPAQLFKYFTPMSELIEISSDEEPEKTGKIQKANNIENPTTYDVISNITAEQIQEVTAMIAEVLPPDVQPLENSPEKQTEIRKSRKRNEYINKIKIDINASRIINATTSTPIPIKKRRESILKIPKFHVGNVKPAKT